jgi:hypothetical protein
VSLIALLILLTLAVLPLPASAWNIPGHMLSGIIAYQVLQQENPQTIEKVNSVLEKHPWYANQWQARLQDIPVAEGDLVLFMQATRIPASSQIRKLIRVYENELAKHHSLSFRAGLSYFVLRLVKYSS